MQPKFDADATSTQKVLRLYHKLLFDGRKHYLSDLAEYLNCSSQTVIRLAAEIELLIGPAFQMGKDKQRRWYQIKSKSGNHLGLEYEELRYLTICRDLASPYLPEQVKKRVDQSILNFSVLMAERDFSQGSKVGKSNFVYCPKGWINYTPFFGILEKLVQALEDRKILKIKYKPASRKKVSSHLFAASRIVSMNNALYALGASVTEDGQEIKYLTNLAVHRIQDILFTDKTHKFNIPESSLELFGLPWHEEKVFRIRFRTEKASLYVSERIWSEKQKMTWENDSQLILELTSKSEPEIMAWIRSFGDEAELLSVSNLPGKAEMKLAAREEAHSAKESE